MDIKVLVDNGKGFVEQKLDPKIKAAIKLMVSIPVTVKDNKAVWKKYEESDKEKAYNIVLELSKENPELLVYYHYFKNSTNNNAYIVIMKQAVIHYMKHLQKTNPSIHTKVIGTVVNVNHPSVIKHLKTEEAQRHPDYNEVVLIMDKMIKQNFYPIVKVNNKLRKTEYVWKKR